ncbi:MAG: hypothetical protein KA314_30305 [Chloroflexi bacterium]|nr:hypothetical protein [Chloroflexota bacterium]MBP8060153.1 hypothetical protein [Chloroflexota bacterium]
MKSLRSEFLFRSIIAIVILLAGVAMAPFVDLPQLRLGWQMFAGVYEANLTVNYPDGQPGSFFHFSGNGFAANQPATIMVNGSTNGQVWTDGNGFLEFNLDTQNAPDGVYTVTAFVDGNSSASASFTLSTTAPLRPREGNGDVLFAMHMIYLPVLRK